MGQFCSLFDASWLRNKRRVLTCTVSLTSMMHAYQVRLRKDKRGVDLISDALPFGRLWYGEPNTISNAIGYVKHRSRSHHAVIRVYDDAGNVTRNARARGHFQRMVGGYGLFYGL
jgi:hypothetical protein